MKENLETIKKENNWLNELSNFFKGKNILILGLGLEGRGALSFLINNFKNIEYKKIYLLDKFKTNEEYNKTIYGEIKNKKNIKSIEEIEQIKENLKILNIPAEEYDQIFTTDKSLKEENEYNKEYDLDHFDIILKSPGIKISDEIREKYNEKIYSQIEIFLKYFPGFSIGITGTKGKSTTSTLMHFVLEKCGYSSHLLGNIGNPVFYELEKIKKNDIVVIELSSFAMEYISTPTNIALITNIFVAHLDYHDKIENYIKAKIKIFENIDKYTSINIENKHNYFKKYLTEKTENFKKANYTAEYEEINEEEIKINKLNLLGDHNILNAKAVKKVLLDLNKAQINEFNFKNLTEENIDNALREFKGLKHRLEIVYQDKNIRYINDSIATVPESTINAIKAVNDLETLILGGDDKKLPTETLIKFINSLSESGKTGKRSSLKNIILLPDSGKRIFQDISEKYNKILAKDVREAVRIANDIHERGSILLSPAARSYGHYKNFEDRGDQFKEEVLKNI